MKRVRVTVRGHVQGVFFRAETRARARSLGVTGSIQNCADGAVEAVFEGEDEAVDTIVRWCHHGPDCAHVEDVAVEVQEPQGERTSPSREVAKAAATLGPKRRLRRRSEAVRACSCGRVNPRRVARGVVERHYHRGVRTSTAAALARTRAGRALRRPQNWLQLVKFSVVGASGYLVNLAVYTLLLHAADVHYLGAAVCSFLVAVTNNYTLNRIWTFRGDRGHIAYQGIRFLIVALLALGGNLLILHGFVAGGLDEVLAQAIAVILVTPLNFVGNKLWSFRRGR